MNSIEFISVTPTGFKPVTAGAEIQCAIQLRHEANLYYVKSCFTALEIAFPSALPYNCFEAKPIIFPISLIEVAPTESIISEITFFKSSLLICSGKN